MESTALVVVGKKLKVAAFGKIYMRYLKLESIV